MRTLWRMVMRRGKVALQTGVLVAALLGLRVVVESYELEFITPGPLLSGAVAGGIFVLGLIVASTLADYKESERMPAEITAAMANLHEDGRSIAETFPTFDVAALERRLERVVITLMNDLGPDDRHVDTCLTAINEISDSIVELERLEIPPNYIVRLRTEQGTLRRFVLRAYQIQRTEFVPSAYALIWIGLLVTVIALTFCKIEESTEAFVLLGVIDFFFLYLIRLIKIFDTPFNVRGGTRDDVDLFLLRDFAAELPHATTPEPTAPAKGPSRLSWRGSS